MAVSWSWAFGQESAVILDTQMGWNWETTSPTFSAPSNTFTYTYPGSPARFSWTQDDQTGQNTFTAPTGAFSPAGWLTLAVYVDSGYTDSRTLMDVRGAGTDRSIRIDMTNSATETFSLYVDNVFKASFTMTVSDWHYVALQYDMSTATWSGRVFVDGVAATALFTDSATAETDGSYIFEGIGVGSRTTYFAQMIVYNSTADAGEAPRFVTRISPDTDGAGNGTWVPPSGAGAQVAVTANDPFNNATFTEATTPVSGNLVTTTFAATLTTQLGVAASNIDGVTGHSYSSGTAISAFAATGATGTFTNGATVVPDVSDTTYGFATAPINPATAAAWVAGDTVQLKYEIV